NERLYTEKGNLTALSLRHILNNELEFRYNLNYLDNYYSPSVADKLNQLYLDFGFKTIWQKYGQVILSYNHGHSLQSEQPDYDKLTLEYSINKDLEFADLIFRISGGIASKETPFNHQFQGGGFSSIPLRAYSYNMAGDRFLRSTIEFHRPLKKGFKLILFSDLGKIVPVGKVFENTDCLISAGIGLSYDTPVQIPVRLDLVVNKDGDISYNIGFGHSY
ncbi:MAG: BamA/TamA family outer membrane protein, partial [Bacillota bacterium]